MAEEVGFPALRLLDIGGGFPGDDEGGITLQEIADVVNPVLSSLFSSDVEVISEPGRFFSHSAATLAARIIGRRKIRRKQDPSDPDVLYYIGDGIYGSFNCMLYDHYTPPQPVPVTPCGDDVPLVDSEQSSRVFGPTCDGLDCVFDETKLPLLQVSDWLVFKNMGAC